MVIPADSALQDLPELAPIVAGLELVPIRRDLHAHPELSRDEHRTTAVVESKLVEAGLSPRRLPGTGLICDIDPTGPAESTDRIALRADLDALPVRDTTRTPWASTVPGVAHACGHDVHTTVVLGAALTLARLRDLGVLPCPVRLVFQPAEEVQPGGALDVIAADALRGVRRILAVHCDPQFDVGTIGLRVGPITSAADHVLVRLHGPGGHTSRPHLSSDLVFGLGEVITGLPGVLSRRVDPRAGASLIWGRVSAEGPYNAIPGAGEVEGTLRILDPDSWKRASGLLREAVEHLVAPLGLEAEVIVTHGVPPTVNDASSIDLLRAATIAEFGVRAVRPAVQSLGGEDFGWYLRQIPGALARLGTRLPGGRIHDLHQGDYEPDESAIEIGARLLTRAVLLSPGHPVRA